ncbi:hypothetical protein NQ318_001850 [Aromia moschata]|uniref:Protein hunchback n=1 Tax=Aromia moschata TaxID=1265417 RepID=A0AAV8Z3X0_9CUCU|nr:hypothetical protein NQ318_001850 [Aromia moschata]
MSQLNEKSMIFTEEGQLAMCYKCAEDLATCFEFKSSRLSLEHRIDSFASHEDSAKRDPFFPTREEYDNRDNLLEHRTVCCFCMKSDSSNVYTSLTDDKNGVNMRVLLNKFFPELLILDVNHGILFCPACNASLESFFRTMNKWATTQLNIEENGVKTHNVTGNYNDLDLLPQCEVKQEPLYEFVKSEECEVKIPVSLLPTETFDPVKLEGEDFSIKREDIDLKIMQDDYKRSEQYANHPSQLEESELDFNMMPKYNFKQHIVTHLDPSNVTMYQCNRCEYKAKRKSDLKQHTVTHSDLSEIAAFRCDQCEFKAKYISRLKQHMLVHLDPSEVTMYMCEKCGYKAKQEYRLKEHMATHLDPSEVVMHTCERCEYKTRHKSSLKRHMISHQNPSKVALHRCERCQYRTMYKSCLKLHMTLNVAEDLSFCAPCNSSLESFFSAMRDWSSVGLNIVCLNDITAHTNTVNCTGLNLVPQFELKHEQDDVGFGADIFENEDAKINIPESDLVKLEVQEFGIKQEEVDVMVTSDDSMGLGEYTVTPSQLENAKMKEDGTVFQYDQTEDYDFLDTPHQYQCELCNYKTRYKSRLKDHMVIHLDPSKTATYQSDRCEYKAKRKKSLTKHKVTHQDPAEITMYQCDRCDYKVKHKPNLKKHMLTHQGSEDAIIQSHQCEICGFKAMYKSRLKEHMCDKCEYKAKLKPSLTKHMVVHQDPSEVSMYQCEICEHMVKHKSNLKKHMMVHQDSSEVTIYQCDKCDYKARYKSHLKEHMLIHLDPSEITLYQCDMCDYKTKHKSYLKKHKVTHQNLSEVTLYGVRQM